ncbi:37S ribosomal protein S24, mitochondrial [Zancudomyces culisetae]|uniref:37S ribosomal protein S24, mitochondrial n=1 Tax=Zancudomyces culisetae TaxID=1213189 RepID=A0A1R1PKT1_ZANCU|nr:37S ribosomal protein S24, mitochondrial [Zancudomyces culisetae]|eukprot:OMH81547.1 37S ribosomal protein S24, mitochondrial [Zancudomyces culisetae]
MLGLVRKGGIQQRISLPILWQSKVYSTEAGENGGKSEYNKRFPAYGRRRRVKHEQHRQNIFDIETLREDEDDRHGDYGHHTFGHWMLESIRDVRKYVRKEKFEIPQLSEFSKPFSLPSAEKRILKFQTTKIHGVVSANNAVEKDSLNRRVTLQVKVDDLKLSNAARHKFLLLAGPRYDFNTDILKISSDREPTANLNKKRLVDEFKALLEESKVKIFFGFIFEFYNV